MSKPKLYYFDAPVSRGEECRLAFSIANADFEDVRISREQWMGGMKAASPFGAVPYLEVEGKPVLAHSNAILGYIGRTHGVHPTDAFEAARHEGLMEAVEELRHKIAPTMRMSDEAQKKTARAELASTTIPTWAGHVEKQMGDGPFLGGSKINVADIKLYMLVKWLNGGALDHIPADVLAKFPKIQKHFEAVRDHAAVKSWAAKHAS